MPEENAENATAPQGMEYGCLFCATGKEQQVAERIHVQCPQVATIVMRVEKHKSDHGRKSRTQAIVLPGYVFFYAPADFEPRRFFPVEHVIRVLTSDEGVWQLRGEDARFAQWLFQYDGLLGFSRAYREQERIRIVTGPLKDMEGQIVRVDKRGRSGQVRLNFNGRQVLVWLGFELIDSLAQDGRG